MLVFFLVELLARADAPEKNPNILQNDEPARRSRRRTLSRSLVRGTSHAGSYLGDLIPGNVLSSYISDDPAGSQLSRPGRLALLSCIGYSSH